jgi:hypothetical protein
MPRKNVSLKKSDKSPSGGLSASGRKRINRLTGSKLKPPVSAEQAKKSPKAAARRESFCARSEGQKEMHNIDCKKTPNKRICLALKKWDC